jgi:hypothetical protein
MKPAARSPFRLALLLGTLTVAGLAPAAFAADKDKPKSDLLPPDKRRATVELAEKLARPPEPAPLPPDLAQPFNPPGFEQPDPAERPPVAAAGGPAAGPGGGADAAAARPAAPLGDRDVLEKLAARIVPGGTFILGGQPILVIGGNRLRVGAHFTVTANNQDYDLELAAIDRTTFTLRYRGEEVIRPINPGKK